MCVARRVACCHPIRALHVGTEWVPSRYQAGTKRVPSDTKPVPSRLPSRYQAGTKWSRRAALAIPARQSAPNIVLACPTLPPLHTEVDRMLALMSTNGVRCNALVATDETIRQQLMDVPPSRPGAPCCVCAGTGRTPATSAPGLGSAAAASVRNSARPCGPCTLAAVVRRSTGQGGT